MSPKINEIKSLLASIETDTEKAYNRGNRAAGVRIRKAMLDIKKLAGEVRKEVSELKGQ